MNAPNHYQLQGDGISVTYYPGGFGPATAAGRLRLIYQHAARSLALRDSEIATVEAPGLGTIVSAELDLVTDFGSTIFNLVLPEVDLPDGPSPSVHLRTIAITRIRSGMPTGHPRGDSYHATPLSGTADVVMIPLVQPADPGP